MIRILSLFFFFIVTIPHVMASTEILPEKIATPYPDLVVGDANAPVTVIVYSSLTCPHCAYFHKHILPDLVKLFVNTHKVRMIHRDYVMDLQGLEGVTLARCSPHQYTALINVLFDKQDDWVFKPNFHELLATIGNLGGISTATFESCLKNESMKERIAASALLARKQYVIKGVPSFIINDQLHLGKPTLEDLSAAIEQAYAHAISK